MSVHVISHQGPHRKRGFGPERFGALAVAMAALSAASWIAPYLNRSAPPPPPESTAVLTPKTPPAAETVKTIATTQAPAPPAMEARRPPPRHRGVPLDARPEDAAEDFEVLSAAELDAISQARSE
jgi:hypothetical protein